MEGQIFIFRLEKKTINGAKHKIEAQQSIRHRMKVFRIFIPMGNCIFVQKDILVLVDLMFL